MDWSPVGLAIADALDIGNNHVHLVRGVIKIYIDGDPIVKKIRMSNKMRDWVEKFDGGKPVSPTTFLL